MVTMTMQAEHPTLARRALESLGARPTDHRVLNVQCRHGHHVAAVFATDAGPVYQAETGPHAHGAASRGTEFLDLLTPGRLDADEIPAWCDCGPWTLSRRALREQLRPKGHTIHLPLA